MKKTISLLLVCIAVFSLCISFEVTAFADQELSATPALNENEQLSRLLAEFSENIQPGTAGSTLKAVQEAVRLMDWGTASKMTYDEIYETVSEFFSDKEDAFIEEYMTQLEQLDETYQTLLTEGQEDLLESAGCTDTAYPWGGEPIDTVEIFFDVMGFRIYTGDYTEFLETYYKAIEEQWPIEELAMAGININNYDLLDLPDALDFFGFTVRDINNDGVEELLIGFMNDMESVNDLYTVSDGYRTLIVQGGAYNETYYVCYDGTICRCTYNGETSQGYHYYNLKNGWLVPVGRIICDASYNPRNLWYIGTDDGWDLKTCSYFPPDMAMQKIQSYEALYADNNYTPFSELHK